MVVTTAFLKLKLIYNVVLVTAVQQIYIYIYIFFFTTIYHGILNIVLCAIQQDLVYRFKSLHLLTIDLFSV